MRLDRARRRRIMWRRTADDIEGLFVALAFYPAWFIARVVSAARLGWRAGVDPRAAVPTVPVEQEPETPVERPLE